LEVFTGKGSAPSAPDPYATAAAQTQGAESVAGYNTALQRPNVVTPYGSTTWQTSSPTPSAPTSYGYPGGETPAYMGGGTPGFPTYGGTSGSSPPQYTETQSLSPALQAQLEQQQATTAQAGSQAQSALANNPLPTTGQNQQFGADARNAAYSYATSTMDPYWNEQQRQMDASLRNSGATPGTPAYDNAMTQFQTQRDQAYSQAENQAFNQGLTAQGEQIQQVGELQQIPLNEYLGLMTGSQISPASGTAPAGQAQAPDIMSAFQNQYQGQLANYNAQVGSQNADIGALGTIIAAAATTASDKRVKKDIEPIHATTAQGNPLYAYRYNFQSGKDPKQVGVIAQEVEKNTPEAVLKDSKGMRYVDYSKA
jgi:Chaperone of endosialidase